MNWKQTLAAYLPTIGVAIGGPMAGLAIKAGLKAFGASADDIKNSGNGLGMLKNLVLGATPENVKAAQEHDMNFKVQMADLGYKVEDLHRKDRQSARKFAQTAGAMWHHIVGMTLIATSISIVFYIIIIGLPIDSIGFATLMIGTIHTWAGGYIVFLFGSSKGSKAKDEQIAEMVKTMAGK